MTCSLTPESIGAYSSLRIFKPVTDNNLHGLCWLFWHLNIGSPGELLGWMIWMTVETENARPNPTEMSQTECIFWESLTTLYIETFCCESTAAHNKAHYINTATVHPMNSLAHSPKLCQVCGSTVQSVHNTPHITTVTFITKADP